MIRKWVLRGSQSVLGGVAAFKFLQHGDPPSVRNWMAAKWVLRAKASIFTDEQKAEFEADDHWQETLYLYDWINVTNQPFSNKPGPPCTCEVCKRKKETA